MGRRSHSTALAVWMNGEHVGICVTAANGAQSFLYDAAWIESPVARRLSLSLPMRPASEPYTGPVLEAFFDNLLPDNREIRARLRRRFGARSTEAFDLLAELGRDCVGALQILPESAPRPDIMRTTARALDAAGVERAIDASLGTALGYGPDLNGFRLSLAGAQEKAAFLQKDGVWCEPFGRYALHAYFQTSHRACRPRPRSLHLGRERVALHSTRRGLRRSPWHHAPSKLSAPRKVLVVERFDRRLAPDGSYWLRLPQEDFCQATGTSPEAKYESQGGPGIRRIMDLLTAFPKRRKAIASIFSVPRSSTGSWPRLTATPRISASSCMPVEASSHSALRYLLGPSPYRNRAGSVDPPTGAHGDGRLRKKHPLSLGRNPGSPLDRDRPPCPSA